MTEPVRAYLLLTAKRLRAYARGDESEEIETVYKMDRVWEGLSDDEKWDVDEAVARLGFYAPESFASAIDQFCGGGSA